MTDWSGRPAYMQVADDLRASILKGELSPGEQLPSYGDLMKDYGVSITVIRSAIRELRTESLVRTHQGKGVFVSDPLPALLPGSGPELPAEALQKRLTVIEAELRSLRESTERQAAVHEQVAALQVQMMDLYARMGLPYPHESPSGRHREREQTG